MSEPSADLSEFKSFAEHLAELARSETLPRFRRGGAVFNKEAGVGFDPVTDADREAERAQRTAIGEAFPEHGIWGEEFGVENGDAHFRWVLDPVDGTRAFVCGAATWTSLIALEKHKRPLIGVIDQGYNDERWVGAPGGTVFVQRGNISPCQTSGVKRLADARLATTDPIEGEIFNAAQSKAFYAVHAKIQLARFSLDAYAYGLLASGHLDLVIEAGLKRHDFSALQPVVEGAGGVFTDWDGGEVSEEKGGRVIAAATPDLHQEVMSVIA